MGSLSTIAHVNGNSSNELAELQGAKLSEYSSEPILEVAPYVQKDDHGYIYR